MLQPSQSPSAESEPNLLLTSFFLPHFGHLANIFAISFTINNILCLPLAHMICVSNFSRRDPSNKEHWQKYTKVPLHDSQITTFSSKALYPIFLGIFVNVKIFRAIFGAECQFYVKTDVLISYTKRFTSSEDISLLHKECSIMTITET